MEKLEHAWVKSSVFNRDYCELCRVVKRMISPNEECYGAPRLQSDYAKMYAKSKEEINSLITFLTPHTS